MLYQKLHKVQRIILTENAEAVDREEAWDGYKTSSKFLAFRKNRGNASVEQETDSQPFALPS
jgi:hypothetical protein